MDLTRDNLHVLCAESERMCRAVAPHELAGKAVYVLPQSALPAEFGRGSAAGAFTHARLDLHLRATVGGRWAGRGFCCVVNDYILADEPPALRRRLLLSRALHELVHAVVCGWRWPEEEAAGPLAELVRLEAVRLAAALADAALFDPPPAGEPPWDHHDASFIRAALHAAWRGRQAGYPVALYDMTPDSCASYGLSSSARYEAVIGDEPRRLARWPFRQILRRRAPPAFRRLWRGDVLCFFGGLLPAPTDSFGDDPMSILADLTADLEARGKQAEAAFRKLAAQIAGGKRPRKDEAEAVLDASNRSAVDLTAEVAWQVRRRELAAQVDAGRQAEAQLERIDAQVAAADRELAAAQRRHAEAVLPLAGQRLGLETVISIGRAAQDAHRRLCCEPVRDRLAELDRRRTALLARRQAAARERDHLAALAQSRADRAAGGGTWADHYRGESDRLSKRADSDPGAVVKECDRVLEELGRAEAALVAAQLKD